MAATFCNTLGGSDLHNSACWSAMQPRKVRQTSDLLPAGYFDADDF
ncbi:MAG: hypothetical protein AAGD11_02000 [Planctomycetota bacterium]